MWCFQSQPFFNGKLILREVTNGSNGVNGSKEVTSSGSPTGTIIAHNDLKYSQINAMVPILQDVQGVAIHPLQEMQLSTL